LGLTVRAIDFDLEMLSQKQIITASAFKHDYNDNTNHPVYQAVVCYLLGQLFRDKHLYDKRFR
jgi:hypothetical protein